MDTHLEAKARAWLQSGVPVNENTLAALLAEVEAAGRADEAHNVLARVNARKGRGAAGRGTSVIRPELEADDMNLDFRPWPSPCCGARVDVKSGEADAYGISKALMCRECRRVLDDDYMRSSEAARRVANLMREVAHLEAQIAALHHALGLLERMRHGDDVLCSACGVGTALIEGAPPLSDRHTTSCFLAAALADMQAAAAAYTKRVRREALEEAAQIAEAAHGAGAHMPHNRVIAAAIRALAAPKEADDAG